MKDNKIEGFLLNSEQNDFSFDTSMHGRIIIHKEKYDDRFDIVYLKHYRNYLEQQDYNIGGYFDKKDKCIYECDFWLKDILPENCSIKLSTFSDLSKKIDKEIQEYIKEYSFKNEIKLKNMAKKKFKDLEQWRLNNHKSNVRKKFIEDANPTIELKMSYNDSKIKNTDYFMGKGLLVEYLNNPIDTIKKYSNTIIEDNMDELGLQLLIYYYKIDYLYQIKNNINNKFSELYISKKMYNSIKDLDAKNINITISYGKKSLQFKYAYNRLKYDLLNDNRGSSDYGVAYNQVSEFIKANDNSNKVHRWNNDFSFAHVTSITYGRKELYKNEKLEKNIKNKSMYSR